MTKPRVKAGLFEMARVAGAEARRIRHTQDLLVRDEAHAGQIRKAEVFEDIERLIYTIVPVQDEVRRVLTPVARARAAKKKIGRSA